MEQVTPTPVKLQKALVIEDNGDMSLLLDIMLNGKTVELDYVKNLAAARQYLQNEQPSVVILDNKLPDGFGVDFINYIRHHYPAVKIIMISGYDASAEDVAIENGADLFLQKPFTKKQLFESLNSLLN